jgi:hypothetical protein
MRAIGLPAIVTIVASMIMIAIVGMSEDGILAATHHWYVAVIGLVAMVLGIKARKQFWLLFSILPLGGSLIFALLVMQACPDGVCS